MKITLENFESHNDDIYDLVIIPEDNDVGGGRITKEEIDVIQKHPQAKSLKISGLKQETFEYLILNYGNQFEAISFFKNKLVRDLSLLGSLSQLKYVYYFFNQKADRLWNMRKNESLVGLAIYDFCKLHHINEIATAPNLKRFAIGDEVWAGMKLESLKPLVNSSVTHFSWWDNIVEDKDFLCLANSKIKRLDLNVCKFRMEELAEIVAAIPDIHGAATKPYKENSIVDVDGNKTTYYLPCKGKRKLVAGKDEDKLKIYIEEFGELVRKYEKIFWQ